MRANERNGFSQTQVAKFAGKLVDRPAREFYDVAVAKGREGRRGVAAGLTERTRAGRAATPASGSR